MPEPLPLWLDRLEFVGKDLKLSGRAEATSYPGVTKQHTWYMLPEAAMLASLKNDRTRALYLTNLCRIFCFLEYNIETVYEDLIAASGTACLSGAQWRLLLGMSGNDAKKSDTQSAKRRKEAEDILCRMIRHTPVSLG